MPTPQPIDVQCQAFDQARRLIDQNRSREILRWQNWRNGGVLGGAPRPDCPEMSAEEDAVIRQLWLTLDGSSCWMSALYMLVNDERPSD